MHEEYDLGELVTLAKLASLIPGRDGKRIAVSTVWRWATGREPRLRTIVRGGTRMSTLPWLREFFAARTAAKDCASTSARTPRQREQAIAAAERQCVKAGA